MNNNNKNSVYEYYIYLPICQNRIYNIYYNENENKIERNLEKISNLFSVKTNRYYFEINSIYEEFGFFTLNNSKISQRILIENDKDILGFTYLNNNNISNFTITIDYNVSIEEEEIYKNQCQIVINLKLCYHSCLKCSKDINESNEEQHNCIECHHNYYPSPENNSNCYLTDEKKENWYFDSEYLKFDFCNAECLCSCTGPNNSNCVPCSTYLYLDNTIEISNNESTFKIIDSETTLNEFKDQIRNDIVSYVNSSNVINGSNFLAMVLTSDDIKPEEQLKKGISAIDLGNCTNVLKEFYNISEEENLIILNMEIKNDENQNVEINNDEDKSFNLGKNTQIEIYDYSGRKLDLSVCNEGIKVMKFIGDADKLDIDSAKILSEQGIDVFNPTDDFFNDICHSYDNTDGKDIIINDRRNDIFQNATFCQNGCTYTGINYNLMAANCICDSNFLQEEENNTTNTNLITEISNFKTITKAFLENLFSFNFNVLKCYNLALSIKILIYNIGFYCMSSMFILQTIFFFIYLIKKLKPLKKFMLKFRINNNIKTFQNGGNTFINDSKNSPPPKNRSIEISNDGIDNKKSYTKRKYKKYNLNENQKNKDNNEYDINKQFQSKIISNNFTPYININKQIIIDNKPKKETKLNKNKNNDKIYGIKTMRFKSKKKQKKKIKNIHKMETIQKSIKKKNIESKIYKRNIITLSKTDYDLQDLDYEEAIIYDKRSFIRMYWGYLVDTQIILSTFFIVYNLDLFVIKLSFLVSTFQISFFLNALFYTDEYISDAYHNDGVLDFFSGLPKSIYSFIATLIITNLLKMLSSSKDELMRVIRRNVKFDNYIKVIKIKLAKLRKKLIVYFFLLFLLALFFLYYVVVFCAVYRYSQKYWFLGCLESFGFDFLVALISCLLLALLRYISIKNRIKCIYILANIINTFL